MSRVWRAIARNGGMLRLSGRGSAALVMLVLCTLVVGVLGAALHPRLLRLLPSLGVLLAAGAVWPWLTVLLVRGRLHFVPDRIQEGEKAVAVLHLRYRGLWPAWGLVLDIDAENRHLLDALRPSGSACRPVTLQPRRRGVLPTRAASLQTGFPCGLVSASRRVPADRPLVVWPRLFPVAPLPDWVGVAEPAGHVETRRVGSSGDTVGVREYRRGDPMRWIHWPQTARHDRFMVREFPASGVPRVRIVLDCDADVHVGAGPDGSFEWAVRIAASLAAGWLAAGAEVALEAGPLRLPPAGGPRQRVLVLDALAQVQPLGAGAAQPTPRSELTTVFVSTDLGWQKRAEPLCCAWRGFLLRNQGFGGRRTANPTVSGKVVAIDRPAEVPAALLRMKQGLADAA